MFQKVLRQLKKGQGPDKKLLKQMLDLALVKKMGVLRMPYLCRTRDPKINPPIEQLLAVAAILGDEEKMFRCVDILITETGEKSGEAGASLQTDEVRRCIDGVFAMLQSLPEELRLFAEVLGTLKKAVQAPPGHE